MQIVELLRENLQLIYKAIHDNLDSSLIEEAGTWQGDEFFALYEMNDELFLFHFSRKTICQLIVFENVPAALSYLHKITQS